MSLGHTISAIGSTVELRKNCNNLLGKKRIFQEVMWEPLLVYMRKQFLILEQR